MSNATIAAILDRCQRNQAYHRKSIGLLRKEKERDTKGFLRDWILLINRILSHSKREAHVKRLVKLVAALTVSCDDQFVEFTINYLLRMHNAKEWGTRYGACQLVALILKDLGEDATLGDDMWNSVYETMMVRLQDRSPQVRPQAVAALARLQDPRDPEDEVTLRYMDMLEYEPSADVRKAIVKNIAITKASIKELVKRTRDIDAKVRKATFGVLASFINIKNLRISQRVELISDGLRDRDPSVIAECEKMCLAWFRQSDMDVLVLLSLLDVSLCDKEAQMVLRLVLKQAEGKPVQLNLQEPLTPEEAVFMRGLAQFWADQNTPETLQLLDSNVPELTALCQLVDMNREDDLVVYHLLHLAMLRDFGDEAGRRALAALLRDMLPSPQTSHDVVEICVKLLQRCHPDEKDFIQVVLEAVSDIREPLDVLQTEQAREKLQEADEQAGALRLKYRKLKKLIKTSQAKNDRDKAKRAHLKAQEIKPQLDRLERSLQARSDLEEHIWHRVLSITELLLTSTKRGLTHPGILGMKEAVLTPALASRLPLIRELGLRCLALYCLLDVTTDTVKQHIHQFTAALRLENEATNSVRSTAIKAVFDILMLYGFSTFTEGSSKISGEELINCLTTYVTDEAEDPEMRGLVVEGFAKLFLMNQCNDMQMLSNLLLLFFSPATNDDVRLRQCLSVFFPTFAFASHAHQQLCADVVVHTLRRVLLGPPDSQLKEIDWTKFSKFLLHLADPSFAQYQWVFDNAEPSWHERITLAISYEMRMPEEGHIKKWARVLNVISPRSPVVATDDESTKERERFMMKTLISIKDGAEKICGDKQALKWIQKFSATLEATMTSKKTRDLLLSEEDVQELYQEIQQEFQEYSVERNSQIDIDPIVMLRSEPAAVLVESPLNKNSKKKRKGGKKRAEQPKKAVNPGNKWGLVIQAAPIPAKRKSDPKEPSFENEEEEEKRMRIEEQRGQKRDSSENRKDVLDIMSASKKTAVRAE